MIDDFAVGVLLSVGAVLWITVAAIELRRMFRDWPRR